MDHPGNRIQRYVEKKRGFTSFFTLGCWRGDWQGFRISSKGCQCGSSSSTILRMPGFWKSHFFGWKFFTPTHMMIHENTMKIFTYMDSMSQGVPKSVKKDWNRLMGFKHRGWIFLRKGERAVKKESLFLVKLCWCSHTSFAQLCPLRNLLENLNWLFVTSIPLTEHFLLFWDKWHVLGACRHLNSDLDSSRSTPVMPTIFGNHKWRQLQVWS